MSVRVTDLDPNLCLSVIYSSRVIKRAHPLLWSFKTVFSNYVYSDIAWSPYSTEHVKGSRSALKCMWSLRRVSLSFVSLRAFLAGLITWIQRSCHHKFAGRSFRSSLWGSRCEARIRHAICSGEKILIRLLPGFRSAEKNGNY